MNKDDATWLRIGYVVFAGLVAFTLWKASQTLGIQTGWSDRYSEFYSPVASLISLVLGALVSLWLAKDQDRHEYFLASVGELRKVTWPSLPDTRRMTVVVCVVVGIFAAILALFDTLWSKILGTILA
jgi:preprotein translocase subunit SecE